MFLGNYLLRLRRPFSASKAASDPLVNAWHHAYALPVVIGNASAGQSIPRG